MLRKLTAIRRALHRMQFSLPVCAGVAIALLGTLVQDMVVDRANQPTTAEQAANTSPDIAASGARRAWDQDLLGVVVASDVVEITARSEGRVVTIPAQLGDRVARGAVLASIDDRNLQDELAAARAATRALVAERDKAQSELEEAHERKLRDERLSYVLSEEELARVRYEEKYAAARLQATRARLDEQHTRVAILERSIDEAQLRAPFDGVIAARYVSPGARVSPGTAIARLVSTGRMLVRFAIPELLGGKLRAGMSVAVDVDGTPLVGIIDKLAPEVDAASRMIVAEAHVQVLDGGAGTALAGRAARVRVTAAPAGEERRP